MSSKRLTDLDELFSTELSDDDYILVTDVDGAKDWMTFYERKLAMSKKIRVGALVKYIKEKLKEEL